MHPSMVVITVLIGMLVVFMAEPYFSKKLKLGGFISRDVYKRGEVYLPSKGGLLILFGGLMAIIAMILSFRITNFFFEGTPYPSGLTQLDEAILYTALIFAFYGVLDDYMDVGRMSKLLLPVLFSYPIVTSLVFYENFIAFPFFGSLNVARDVISFGSFGLNLSQIIRFAVVPLYIMVVANLVNMHSGFNGLQSGLSLIVLLSLLVKAILDGDVADILVPAAITGGLAGFWWYNRYPARLFEGNTGSLVVGATIGGLIVTQGYYVVGFVMLIPHTVNFLMYAYWRAKRKMKLKRDEKLGEYHHTIKFGRVREDGTLEVPNRLTLKWVIPYHWRVTEKQVVLHMYALTGLFCIIGVLLPAY